MTILERNLSKAEALAAAESLRNLASRLAGIIANAETTGSPPLREHVNRTLAGYVGAIDRACDRVQASLSVFLTANAVGVTRGKTTQTHRT